MGQQHNDFTKAAQYNPAVFRSDKIILQKINNSPEEEKWLIFVSKKQDGARLKNQIGSGLCSFVYSDKKLLAGRKEIAINKSFDKKVLIATTVLDNGISLDDDLLKNIVIDTTDRVQLIQMLGRKRLKDGEHINLYVKDKIETDFEKYLKHTEQILRNIKRSRHFTPDFENELIQKEFIGERYFSFDPRLGRHLANPYSDYYLNRKAIEYVKIKHKLHNNENAFKELVCEWLEVKYEVENPAQAETTADDEEKELLSTIWKELEAEIKPYADEKRKISKDETARLEQKYDSLLKEHKRRRSSGIRTRKGHHMDNLNSILNFFAEKGFDKYELSGKENYKVELIPDAKERSVFPIETTAEETEPVDDGREMPDSDYNDGYYDDYDDGYDDSYDYDVDANESSEEDADQDE